MSKALADIDLSKLSKADLVQVLGKVLAGEGDSTPEAPAKEEPKTSKQQADDLIEASPYTHTSGRVYFSGAHIEAAARVLKTGTPEIVKTAEGKRTAAVAIWRQSDDSVAAQNLRSA